MSYPANLKYTKDHEWIDLKSDGTAIVGITGYALEQLGDVVFLELPKVGATLNEGASFGTIESTKTVSDLYAPVSGKIAEVNSALTGDDYSKLTDDPYKAGWLVKMSGVAPSAKLMSNTQYESYIAE